MKNFTKAMALSLAATTTSFLPVQAHAGIETLEECYQTVINWCNQTYPNADCSQTSGLDDCDEVFGNAGAGMVIDGIFIRKRDDGTYTLRFETSYPNSPASSSKKKQDDGYDYSDNKKSAGYSGSGSGSGDGGKSVGLNN